MQGELGSHRGHVCFLYVAQKCAGRSDRKSGKWLEGREKSGNFVMKI